MSAPGMRVLAFCDYFSPDSSGGTERAALEVYRRMISSGAQVAVVTAVSSSMSRPSSIDGIRVHVVPAVDLTRILRAQVSVAPTIWRVAASIAREFRPDVLHAHNLYFQSSLAAARVQRSSGLPLVTTAQIGNLTYLREPVRSLTACYERMIGGYILRRSARVIAVSPSVRAHLLRRGVPTAKIDVVPNGVDLDRFEPRAQMPGPCSQPVVMFVGRLVANKGPQLLMDALIHLHAQGVGYRAVFIGDGPLRPVLERQARQQGLGAAVRFTGQLPDVSSLTREADVIVRPSLTEGLSLTVLEAMASGVCVIASDIPENRDLIRHGENGFTVPAGKTGPLADALRLLLTDHSLRRRLADGGYRTSRAYSWERCTAGNVRALRSAWDQVSAG